METPDQTNEKNNQKYNGHIWGGLVLLAVGGVLLMRQFDFPFPYWFFTWPMILIAIGIFSGFKHGFRGPGWIIMIGVGGIFLSGYIVPELNLRNYALPLVILAAGLMMIFRPRKWRECNGEDFRNRWHMKREARRNRFNQKFNSGYNNPNYPGAPTNTDYATSGFTVVPDPNTTTNSNTGTNTNWTEESREDYIDSVAVFGSIRKVVVSKNFKGGEATSFFGGTELFLNQADINGTVVLELTQVFGGAKLIVPPTWNIKSEVTAVFGGVDDKRMVQSNMIDPNKVLILKGTSVFGGLEIHNY